MFTRREPTIRGVPRRDGQRQRDTVKRRGCTTLG